MKKAVDPWRDAININDWQADLHERERDIACEKKLFMGRGPDQNGNV